MLRWHTVVVESMDPDAQASWWCSALGWARLHTDDRQIVIVPPSALADPAPDPLHRGPGLIFVRVGSPKRSKNRLHLDLAPTTGAGQSEEVERLIALGASRADVGQGASAAWAVLADPEGNEFCVLPDDTP